MQKAFEAFPDDGTTARRLLHREESQAIVLGAALAAIAGNGTKTTSAVRRTVRAQTLRIVG